MPLEIPEVPWQELDWWTGWSDAIKLLGIERFQSAFGELGLAGALAADPGPLTAAFRRILEAALADHGERWEGVIFTGSRLSAELRTTFAALAAAYGEEDAEALYRWARRLLPGANAGKVWSRWYNAFRANTWHLINPRARSTPLPFGAAMNVRVEDAIVRRVGPEQTECDGALLAGIAAVAPSTLELRITEPMKCACRVCRRFPPQRQDLMVTLRATLQDRRACQIWEDLDTWLSDAEREQLLAWGHRQEPWRQPDSRTPPLWLPERTA